MNNQLINSGISIVPGCLPSTNTNRFTALTSIKSMEEKPGQFASLAHEIRNPLSTINLSAEMLRSLITDEDQRLFLDMIVRGSMRINDILTDVHTAIQANKMQAEKYSINQLLDEVVAMAGDKIMLKHITIRKDYASKDFKIMLDRPQMKIALTNIIINAIDAMAPGQGKLTLVTKSSSHACVARIEDNGCGISQGNLKNIFKPYFTNKPDGLGLGLATTKEILRSNHVKLHVRSQEAKGTCFTLVFEKKPNKLLQGNRPALFGKESIADYVIQRTMSISPVPMV